MKKASFEKIYNYVNGSKDPFAMYMDNEKVAYGNYEGSHLVVDLVNELIYHYRYANKEKGALMYPVICEVFEIDVVQYIQKYFTSKEDMVAFINKIPENKQSDKDRIINLDY